MLTGSIYFWGRSFTQPRVVSLNLIFVNSFIVLELILYRNSMQDVDCIMPVGVALCSYRDASMMTGDRTSAGCT